MMSSNIRRCRRQTNFTMISNVGLEDKRLSWKAKGLLAYLLSKPDDWLVIGTHLAGVGPDGRDAVATGLLELEACGYLVRKTLRDETGRFVHESEIYDEPIFADYPITDNPTSDNPAVVSTDVPSTETATATTTTTTTTATALKTNDTTVCFRANAENETAVAEEELEPWEIACEEWQTTGLLFPETEPAMKEISVPRVGKAKTEQSIDQAAVKGDTKSAHYAKEVTVSGKAKTSKATETGKLMQDILAAYIDVLGYQPNVPAEVRAAKALAMAGTQPDEITRCYAYYKAQSFWSDKHLGLATISKNMGAFRAVEKKGDRKYATPTGRIDLRMSTGAEDCEDKPYTEEELEYLRKGDEAREQLENKLRATGRYDWAINQIEHCRLNHLPIPNSLVALKYTGLAGFHKQAER